MRAYYLYTLTHVREGMATCTWSETVRIRHAVPDDVPGVLWLIQVVEIIMLITFYFHHYILHSNACVWQLLAEYEKEPHKPKLKKEGSLMLTVIHL